MSAGRRNNALMNPIETALLAQARHQFELAQQLCHADCCDYHAAWPFLRVARLVGGIDADRAPLTELLHPLLQRPGLRVLIAGCADSAQLALVQELAAGNAPSVTVIDRCATPLAACSAITTSGLGATQVLQLDALALRPDAPFDLILCHSLFPFLAASQRSELLRLFSRWLAPQGRLVLAVKLDPANAAAADMASASAPEEVAQWVSGRTARAIRVLDDLPPLQGVDKPALLSAVAGFYRFMAGKPTPYASAEQLLLECAAAGLMLRQRRAGGVGQGYPGAHAAVSGLASVLLELSATGAGTGGA